MSVEVVYKPRKAAYTPMPACGFVESSLPDRTRPLPALIKVPAQSRRWETETLEELQRPPKDAKGKRNKRRTRKPS